MQFFTLIPNLFLDFAEDPWLASYGRFEFGSSVPVGFMIPTESHHSKPVWCGGSALGSKHFA